VSRSGNIRVYAPPSGSVLRSTFQFMVGFLLAAAGHACSVPEPPPLDVPVSRVISLVPTATETMQALEVEHLLIARNEHDPPLARELPSIGAGQSPDVEHIAMLNPDVVIVFEGPDGERVETKLHESAIPTLTVRPVGIAGIFDQFKKIGWATGRGEEADSLVASIERSLGEIRGRNSDQPIRQRVALVMPGEGLRVAGAASFVHALIELVGRENAFGDLPDEYPSITEEDLVSRAIDLVLVAGGKDGTERIRNWFRDRCISVGYRFSRPGPNLVATAELLEKLLTAPASFRCTESSSGSATSGFLGSRPKVGE